VLLFDVVAMVAVLLSTACSWPDYTGHGYLVLWMAGVLGGVVERPFGEVVMVSWLQEVRIQMQRAFAHGHLHLVASSERGEQHRSPVG
jgi:hypothetical protein